MSEDTSKEKRSHWPAICRAMDCAPFLSNVLYPDEESAKEDLGDCFERLAKELPSVFLECKGNMKTRSLDEWERVKKNLKLRKPK